MEKENDILVQEIHDICSRQLEFDEALKDKDLARMVYIFTREQAAHISSLSDSVTDPDLKVLVAGMAARIKVETDEKYFSMRS